MIRVTYPGYDFTVSFRARTLVAFRRHGATGEDQLASLLVCWDIESLAIQHLKLHEMNMQGMHAPVM